MNHQKISSELLKIARELIAVYVPEGSVEERYDDIGLVVYLYGKSDVPYAIAYAGKSSKPLWNYRFRSEDQRRRKIDETVEDLKKSKEFKDQRKEERRSFRHELKKGDILYSSWGYDQTNVDFYEVTESLQKAVRIRQVASKVVSSSFGSEKVVPVAGKFIGPPMLKRVSIGNCVKIESYASACKWDGRPVSQTAFGFGH